MPKVSVIIPVYNTVPYLEECIISILNQTLKDIEIIIVDDGSTDGSSEIIDYYSKIDNRILVIKQENKGLSLARNVALEFSKGDYIYFMDSDDILYENTLFDCFCRCEQENLDIVFFDGEVIYEKGFKEICWDYDRSNIFDDLFIYKGKSLIFEMLRTYTFRAVPWLYFVKAEYLKKIDLYFLPDIIHEDEIFTLLLYLQSNKIGYLKRSLIYHRVRENSTMSNTFSLFNVECYFKVIKELHTFKEQNKEFEDVINLYCRYTMNAICQSAKQLSYKDRIIFYYNSKTKGFDRYIDIKNTFKLFI